MREFMRRVAAYIMSGYLPAITVVAFGAVLALLLQPLTLVFAYVSGGALALVTLRRGPASGALVMGASLVLVGLLGFLLLGSAAPLALANLVYWLPLWLIAGVLRATVRLDLAILAALGLGLVILILVYLGMGDPAAWWSGHLGALFDAVHDQGGPDLAEYLPLLARWMTALAVAGLVMGVNIGLLLGRWWQALLYNPGGFGDEFRQLSLGKPLAVAVLLLGGMAQIAAGALGQIAADALLIAAAILLLQGLAVVHAEVKRRQRHVAWLVGIYVMLLIAPPQVASLLAVLGLLDNWLGFRKRAAP